MGFFTGFLSKVINMIIKIQSMINMNAQKFNPGFTSYFNIGYLDVNRYLITLQSDDIYQHLLL